MLSSLPQGGYCRYTLRLNADPGLYFGLVYNSAGLYTAIGNNLKASSESMVRYKLAAL